MKIIAFIMAILVLALSIMPCADNGIAVNDGNVKTELSKAGHPQDDQHQDDCSPFCHCTCCAGFSVNHFIASIVTIPHYESKSQTAYLLSDMLEISLPIWQPPQLV